MGRVFLSEFVGVKVQRSAHFLTASLKFQFSLCLLLRLFLTQFIISSVIACMRNYY